MAKKKSTVALFEVISKARDKRAEIGLGVPRWMGKPQEDRAPEVRPPQEAQVSRAGRTAGEQAEPIFSVAGGRVRVSLDYVGSAVVLIALMVLIGAAFVLGRQSAPPRTAAAGMGGPGGPSPKARGGRAQSTSGPAVGPGGGQRQVGKYYLVIQDMMGMNDTLKAEAFKIRDFCERNGKRATVHPYRNRTYIVWSLDAFDRPDSAEARRFALEIEHLGQMYGRAGGRYDFKQRHEGRFDPLFLQHR